ncbi:MAG: hypothetical protein HY064_13845 [Bacteroidetes bacterium]|nr:hypothetical protein [Bacteroidota bacterium]
MNAQRFFTATIGVAMIAALAFTACRKDETEEETSSSEDHAMLERTDHDITSMSGQAADITGSSLSNYRTGADESILSNGCATITRDSANHTVTITFNGGTCQDGRTRSGSLLIDYSASTNGAMHYRDPGFVCSVTSNNYVVDGNAVNIITKVITNTTPFGFDALTTNLTWHIVAHVSVTKSAGGTIDWNCDRTKELLNTSDANVYHGSAQPISWNLARIGLTGSSHGTCADGESFTGNITSQLIRDFGGCNIGGKYPIIQGAIDFTKGTRPVRHIDFGNGACDDLATVTVNNHTRTITLH